MRLLVDARVGWGHGIGRMVSSMLPIIASARSSWAVRVLVCPEDYESACESFFGFCNIEVVSCAVRPFSIKEQIGLEKFASDVDLTWFTNYWVPLLWRGKFVNTVHDLLHLVPELHPSSAVKRFLSRLTFHKVRSRSSFVAFVSRFTKREFISKIGMPHRHTVVQLGGDHLDYGPIQSISAKSKQIIVVAASKKHKNFDMLLRAWSRANVGNHWKLVIISRSTNLISSIDICDTAHESRNTSLFRDISNEDLSALYRDSSIFLMPSLYEGFGLPLLEGMLAGNLCISSAAEAMVEVGGGCFVQYVNGTDVEGWTAAIEAYCTIIDEGEFDFSNLLRFNAWKAGHYRWSDSADQMLKVLEHALSI